MPLNNFHPVVAEWFSDTFEQPTEVQKQAWTEIKNGWHTLIAAPTGSGKTLAAFFALIDDLVQQGLNGQLEDQTQIVYVSPLKALSNDIERNLQFPLEGIQQALQNKGLPHVNVEVAVRTGDTSSAERAAMIRRPPHILVTTPESLYLLLTSVNGRKMLSSVHTLIVDEIHALVGDKRGSHLSLSVERLNTLTGQPLRRIGLSATQKPIEHVAAFLTGNDPEQKCRIIDTGHRRELDISLEVPRSQLSAVMAAEVWDEVYERLVELIESHQTTLIFVNTRRLSERLAHHLSDRIGPEFVAAHHGSMSKEQRFDAEQHLKSGKLKVLVATASLELGIDIGSVNLVCQLSSPKSIAAFIQRVGRSGHYVGGTPKGIIFPFTRDELVECTALIDAVRRGELDQVIIPEKPVDILAQQIVAEVAAEEWETGALYNTLKKAYPFRDLKREEFDEIIKMLSEGFTTRRGRRGAYIHYDAINGKVRGRKGARLTALTSGGAIPDTFNYDVVLEPENTYIGNLNEDFAIESMPGDIFQLGNHSWRILRVEEGKVRVADARDLPPSLPFWLGEGPGRTRELSEAVSRLRKTIGELLHEDPLVTSAVKKDNKDGNEAPEYELKDPLKNKAIQWLMREVGLGAAAAEQLVLYLAAAQNALGVMPTRDTIVMERFFDEVGDMHLVVHSPFGSRLNKAWGLSLRKRFCKQFNFELQAAATEDNVILSLGSTHSFPLEEVYHYLNSKTVREILIQAMLDSPMFEIRWRWNASRALAILRMRGGKKVPPQIQRMNAEDLVAQVFPDQLACFENIDGAREVPDHPLVAQTIHDCLTEAMDIEELEELIGLIEQGALQLHAKDLREPSPLAQEILNARPYSFLDDAPLEERRTRAVRNRRWLDPSEALELGRLDKKAIQQVQSEAWPIAENEDELHDALILLGYLTDEEILKGDGINNWQILLSILVENKRAYKVTMNGKVIWIAAERCPQLECLEENKKVTPVPELPTAIRQETWTAENALKELVRGRLEGLGPVTATQLANTIGIGKDKIDFVLMALENEGFVFRGNFTEDNADEMEWCERRLLARIHRYTLESLRKSIEPLSTADFMRFLLAHHRMNADEPGMGPEALQDTIDKLQGMELPAGAWETDVLPGRTRDYDPSWLDVLCMSGRVVWGRFSDPSKRNKNIGPLKSTPISIFDRSTMDCWDFNNGIDRDAALSTKAKQVKQVLEQKGASFFQELIAHTGLLGTQVESALAELVANGMVTSDSFTGLRALLTPVQNRPSPYSRQRREKRAVFGIDHAGRWSLLMKQEADPNEHHALQQERFEKIAFILLKRYGVVFRRVLEKEQFLPPWRDLVRVFRRLEAKGEVRGGRFVVGVSGEQYALPETVERLRYIRKQPKEGRLVSMSAVDPLNFASILFPGIKVTQLIKNRILFRDGVPVAILESGKTVFLEKMSVEDQWQCQKALVSRVYPPKLKAYLGKNYS